MEAEQKRLRFVLELDGKFQDFKVRAGEAVSIGRAPCSGLLIEDSCVSSQHVQLHAAPTVDGGKLCLWGRDMSRNGTGILDEPHACTGEPDVRKLRSDRAEELCHGTELIIPLSRSQSKEEKLRARLVLHLLAADEPLPAPSKRPYEESSIAAACMRVARIARQPATALVLAAAGVSASNGFPADDPHSVAAFALSAETPCLPPGGMRPMPRPMAKGPMSQVVDGQSQNGGLDAAGLPDSYNPVTGTGRWRYENRLGEGGLGVVYRATDRKGDLGEVAVKVLKRNSRFPKRDARHAFAMHRESQWSIRWLHNESDERYRAEPAALFARYIEDHTGFSELGPESFEEKRRRYEAPDFDWDIDGPSLPPHPYVVMEYVKGEALQVAIDRERRPIVEGVQEPPALSTDEKRAVVVQATLALEYLALFSLLHRDFRGCNMHLVSRAGDNLKCSLKVLDLGVMICGEDGQEKNSNSAVQAFRRRGATEEKRRRYDWLPWEVRDGADGKGPVVNFCYPPHSFDVFSLGVLILHLLVGKTEARATLDYVHTDARIANPAPLGIDVRLLQRMLSREATERPPPTELLDALERRGFLSKRIPLLPTEAAVAPVAEQAAMCPVQPPAISVAPSALAEPSCVPEVVEALPRPVSQSPPGQVVSQLPRPEVSEQADVAISGARAGKEIMIESSPTRRSHSLSCVRSRSRSRSTRQNKQSKGVALELHQSEEGPPASGQLDKSRSRSRERKQKERRDRWAKVTDKSDMEAQIQADAQEQARAIARAHAEACAKVQVQADAQEQARAIARAHAEACAKAKAEECRRAEAQFYEAQQLAKAKAEAEAKARAEAEAARVEAEAKAQAEAAERSRAEVEAKAKIERERAEAEARSARFRAEAEAAERARAEAATERARVEAEARAKADRVRAEAETKARTTAEAAAIVERVRAETEAKKNIDREKNGKVEIPNHSNDRSRVVAELLKDVDAKFDDKAHQPDSKSGDTPSVVSRGVLPPPPPPPRRATPSQSPPGSVTMAPSQGSTGDASASALACAVPKGGTGPSPLAAAIPKAGVAAVESQQNLFACAVAKSKGPEAAFPPANFCFPSPLNFGAVPGAPNPAMLQGFPMPSPMMGMPSVGLAGQMPQMPEYLQQAWASQQYAAGFAPNFGNAAMASWNAFQAQALQAAVAQQPVEHQFVGTTRCVRPVRPSTNGNWPY